VAQQENAHRGADLLLRRAEAACLAAAARD
jgi:hypothetical protein